MTKKEKYLKDGIDINKFAYELTAKISRWDDLSYYSKGIEEDILEFFNERAKPTLTEDERVILRNIDKENYFYIGRDTVLDSLYLLNDSNEKIGIDMFDNLFQFIKERRRIFY